MDGWANKRWLDKTGEGCLPEWWRWAMRKGEGEEENLIINRQGGGACLSVWKVFYTCRNTFKMSVSMMVWSEHLRGAWHNQCSSKQIGHWCIKHQGGVSHRWAMSARLKPIKWQRDWCQVSLVCWWGARVAEHQTCCSFFPFFVTALRCFRKKHQGFCSTCGIVFKNNF